MKNKIKIFVLEDDPFRREWFNTVFSDCDLNFSDRVKESLDQIRTDQYDMIFLDRDIGHPKENGEDVAWAMKEEGLAKKACVIVHTVNPRGQRNMKKYLASYHDNFYMIDFTQLRKMKREDFKMG